MSDAFIGEVIIFAGNFAPRGWSFCDGQLLPINQNTALFSLIGTIYGGDGRTTFALPNLKGRAPKQAGSGPGLSAVQLGQRGGADTHVLDATQLPPHRHTFFAESANADKKGAGDDGNRLLGTGQPIYVDAASGNPNRQLSPEAVGPSGSSQAINTNDPYLVVNYIICLQGTYPSRS